MPSRPIRICLIMYSSRFELHEADLDGRLLKGLRGFFGLLRYTRTMEWSRKDRAVILTSITRAYEAALLTLMQRADG